MGGSQGVYPDNAAGFAAVPALPPARPQHPRVVCPASCYNVFGPVLNRATFLLGALAIALGAAQGCSAAGDESVVSNVHPVDGGIFVEAGKGGAGNKGGSGGSGTGGSGQGGGFGGNAGVTGDCVAGEEKQYGACGKCGTAIQKCVNDAWGPVECLGEGVCDVGQTETMDCGTGGTQTRSCNGACEWDAWSTCQVAGPCTPGQTESEDCGNCGSRTRTCDGSSQWGAWGTCDGQGVCMIGQSDTQSCGNCGTKTRTCNSSCQWDAFGACAGEGVCGPGQTDTADCGNCGTKTRSCTNSCTWGAYGSCAGEGECAPGTTGPSCMCSTYGSTTACCGVQKCTNSCTWGACALKTGAECDWESGSNWRCCGTNSWQFCLSTCKWSTACASGCNCGC